MYSLLEEHHQTSQGNSLKIILGPEDIAILSKLSSPHTITRSFAKLRESFVKDGSFKLGIGLDLKIFDLHEVVFFGEVA